MILSFIKSIFQAIENFSRMIKLSHTVFALPFALVAVIIIWRRKLTHVSLLQTFYIVMAFTAVRSFSMAINRIADAAIDAKNPRTANREIPRGILSVFKVKIFAIVSVLSVWLFSWLLSPVAFYFSFPALVLLAGYSYSKRFTWLCHIWLGAVIGMAPLAVYIALTQTLTIEAFILFVTLTGYISGFDILYSIQDIDFDKKMNLYSMPSRLGITPSLWISSFLHLISTLGFIYLGFIVPFGYAYYFGVFIIFIMILAEHLTVGWGSKLNKDKIPAAFFNYNSVVSISFIVFSFLDVML
jgi:4-hydroxybenzoate polyprenyltransferase